MIILYWLIQGPKCASCSPGTVSEAASATCSPCKAGQIARNSLTCEACPVGTYAPERSTLCRACPHRHVSGAESSSCQLCESIFFRVLPDDRRERCTVSPLDIAFALTAWMALTCFVMSFLVGCYSKLAVEDLSVQGEKLAVTTSLPHCFLRWDWASPEVYFTCTGVPDLDGANTWKGKAQSIDELSLQSEKSNLDCFGMLVLGELHFSQGSERSRTVTSDLHPNLEVVFLVWGPLHMRH